MTVAVDLGGTNVKMALFQDGEISAFAVHAARRLAGWDTVLRPIEEQITAWTEEFRAPVKVIGFGFPGLVDAAVGRVIGVTAKYDGAMDFDFHAWAEGTFGAGIVLDNDATAALIGEVDRGVALGLKDVVLITLGTGVGVAACMDGRIIRGRHNQAACLMGHMPAAGDVYCPGCGATGCVESIAGTWGLAEQIRRAAGATGLKEEPCKDYKALKRYCDAHDPIALSIYSECVGAAAALIRTLIYAYDPQMVVLSGGVMQWGNSLMEDIRTRVVDETFLPWGTPAFAIADDMSKSVLYGLYARARQLSTGGEG